MSGFLPFDEPKPRRETSPRPWPGCDTYSEEWRLYCSAWQRVHAEDETRRMRFIRMMTEFQGYQAGEALKANIKLVEQDKRGLIDRARIPDLLKRASDMPKQPMQGRRR